MGVAAEGELGSAVRDDLTPPGGWIVLEHEDEGAMGRAKVRVMVRVIVREIVQTTPGPS
jgi:hypothetical protein